VSENEIKAEREDVESKSLNFWRSCPLRNTDEKTAKRRSLMSLLKK